MTNSFLLALRLLFVRHGLSTFNQERRIQGREDLSELTELGKHQATKTGIALSNLAITAIYSSPLKRAADTSNQIIDKLSNRIEPIFDDGLLEVELGEWAGMTVEEVSKSFPEEYEIWKSSPENLILTNKKGKEFKPIKELISQARVFLNKVIKKHLNKENQTVLIVAHNAILRCLMIELIGCSSQGFRKIQLDNTSISIFNLKSSNGLGLEAQIECLNSTAHLSTPLPKKGKGARLILVRHGETDWNLEGRFQGQIDIPLNENGKSQAASAGLFLSQIKLHKVFSSSMSRPKETAEIILKSHPKLPIELKDGLIEIGHGLWEGKLESEIRSDWPKLLEDWQKAPETVQMPKGESINQVWARAIRTWQGICDSLNNDQTALVVAHDAVNKTILCHLLGLSPADIWAIKQGNGGVSVIDISDSSEHPDKVTCMNLTSHLGGLLDDTATGAL